MLDIKYIRDNKDKVKENSKNRLANVDIDKLLKLDDERRELIQEIDSLRAKRNEQSKTKPTTEIISKMKQIGEEISQKEKQFKESEPEYQELLRAVPNITHKDVKLSSDEADNPVLETYLEPTKFDFEAKDHVELALNLDLIDFDRAVKVTGPKFYYLKNELVLLELALVKYALDICQKHGYAPFITPDLAKREILEGVGFNPRGESTQIYNIEKEDLSLVATAEITMGGYHQNETLLKSDLPKKYVALSHCFRTEAGSYSKYAKGIFRVHQFTKLEMFAYTLPKDSQAMHQEILEIEKEIYNGLKIPYRVIDHSTADLGTPAYRTFDLEAWMPGKPNKKGRLGDYAEITSTSNTTDFQSRGLNIKYKDDKGNKDFLHMLNGTAIASSRTLIAILENYQQKDMSIKIPEILVKYVGIDQIKR